MFRIPIGWKGLDLFDPHIVRDCSCYPNAILRKLSGVGERLKHRHSQALGAVNDTDVGVVPAAGM